MAAGTPSPSSKDGARRKGTEAPAQDASPMAHRSAGRNLAGGVGVAVSIALVASVPAIGGIATWKIVLGAIGLGLILISGFSRSRP